MSEELKYNEVRGSQVIIIYDGQDYEIQLNNVCVATTGDEDEAYIIAESLDVALSILHTQSLLKDRL